MKRLHSSPHNSQDRGQNEPLAALLAVGLFISGVLLFVGYHQELLLTQSDSAVEEPTLDRVYADLTADGPYTVTDDDLESTIEAESLPNGYLVVVTIESLSAESGQWETLDSAYYSTDGDALPADEHAQLDQAIENDEPGITTADRPIIVEDETDRRGARLHVTVVP